MIPKSSDDVGRTKKPYIVISKQILITGASGFLGRYLVEACIQVGYRVFAGVRATSPSSHLVEMGATLFHADLTEMTALRQNLIQFAHTNGGFDYVIHNAGATGAKYTTGFFEINAEATKDLAQAIQETQSALSKFVFISSLSAMGPSDDIHQMLTADDPPYPITRYGASKLLGERYLQEIIPAFPWLIFRPTWIYGPGDHNLIKVFKTVQKGVAVRLGPKAQQLTLIHASDLAQAVTKSLAAPVIQKTYLLSDGKAYPAPLIMETAAKVAHQNTMSIAVPKPILLGVAYMSQFLQRFGVKPIILPEKVQETTALSWACDTTPAQEDLDWSAHYDLYTGFQQTYGWYVRKGWL